jgi:hypothetical protein
VRGGESLGGASGRACWRKMERSWRWRSASRRKRLISCCISRLTAWPSASAPPGSETGARGGEAAGPRGAEGWRLGSEGDRGLEPRTRLWRILPEAFCCVCGLRWELSRSPALLLRGLEKLEGMLSTTRMFVSVRSGPSSTGRLEHKQNSPSTRNCGRKWLRVCRQMPTDNNRTKRNHHKDICHESRYENSTLTS